MLGTIKYKYIGEEGGHTEITIDGKKSIIFHLDTSLLLMLWCAIDQEYKDINKVLSEPFNYIESSLADSVIRRMKLPTLFSKYDLVYDTSAVVNCYLLTIALGHNRIDVVRSAMRDVERKIVKIYNLTELEVIYETGNIDEIYESGSL